LDWRNSHNKRKKEVVNGLTQLFFKREFKEIKGTPGELGWGRGHNFFQFKGH